MQRATMITVKFRNPTKTRGTELILKFNDYTRRVPRDFALSRHDQAALEARKFALHLSKSVLCFDYTDGCGKPSTWTFMLTDTPQS